MLYFTYNHELGEVDAYDRVLDGEHRDVVKQAFNAMVQSSSPLNQKPDKINMDGLEMDWRELRQRILDAHKPIQDLFFRAERQQATVQRQLCSRECYAAVCTAEPSGSTNS